MTSVINDGIMELWPQIPSGNDLNLKIALSTAFAKPDENKN